MAQVCPRCKHVYEGTGRHRCPECKSPYYASQVDLPRPGPLTTPPPVPEPPTPPVMKPPEPGPRGLPPLKPPEADRPRKSRPRPAEPGPTAPPLPRRADARAGVGETVGIEGFDISKLNIARKNYHLELPDKTGEWRTLYSIAGTGKSPAFGRNLDNRLEAMRWVATKHVKFENTSRGLFIKPYDTLNGVYRMIKRPAELRPGARFRIGNFIMTFRESLVAEPEEPRVLEGEQLLARDLKPLGEIEFLRPDGRPGVRFPILKPGETVLGRGGVDPSGKPSQVDLPLVGDPKVSARHAQIVWGGQDSDQPYLEDLGSKSGTWLQVEDVSPVSHGDTFWLGELYLRVVEDH